MGDSMRSPESFEAYHARCVRALERIRRDGGQDDPGGQHRLVWYETRVEATLLDDGELAQAIEATGPVHPHIASEDIRAVRRHALVDEQRRRERRTAQVIGTMRASDNTPSRRSKSANLLGDDPRLDRR